MCQHYYTSRLASGLGQLRTLQRVLALAHGLQAVLLRTLLIKKALNILKVQGHDGFPQIITLRMRAEIMSITLTVTMMINMTAAVSAY